MTTPTIGRGCAEGATRGATAAVKAGRLATSAKMVAEYRPYSV